MEQKNIVLILTVFAVYIIVCFVYICVTHHDVFDRSTAAQEGTVGQNSQKSMLACIQQNVTRFNRTYWYFWHTTFHIFCIWTCWIFSWHTKHRKRLYLGWCSQGLSVWPWWAHSAGSRTSTDTPDHRNASSQLSTSQTLSGYLAPYSSHTLLPSGHKETISEHYSLFFVQKHLF